MFRFRFIVRFPDDEIDVPFVGRHDGFPFQCHGNSIDFHDEPGGQCDFGLGVLGIDPNLSLIHI